VVKGPQRAVQPRARRARQAAGILQITAVHGAPGDGTPIALDRSVAATAIKRLRPDAVTAVELIWTVPPPVLPLAPARPGVLATPLTSKPSLHELAAIARAIGAEVTFRDAALRLERELCRLTRCGEGLCVAFDWPRRVAWTAHGAVADQVTELVAQVAGSGRCALIGNAVIAPIGPAPARAVIALRRATAFRPPEIELVAGLARGVAATFERLLSARP